MSRLRVRGLQDALPRDPWKLQHGIWTWAIGMTPGIMIIKDELESTTITKPLIFKQFITTIASDNQRWIAEHSPFPIWFQGFQTSESSLKIAEFRARVEWQPGNFCHWDLELRSNSRRVATAWGAMLRGWGNHGSSTGFERDLVRFCPGVRLFGSVWKCWISFPNEWEKMMVSKTDGPFRGCFDGFHVLRILQRSPSFKIFQKS